MINIRLFPTLMIFLTRLYLTKNYVWIRVHDLILFLMFLRNNNRNSNAVTKRSIILCQERCLCSNYVFSKKLSILDCFWFWITISWSRSVVLDKTNESFSFPLNLEYSSNFSAIFNASRSHLISGSPIVSSSSSPRDVFVLGCHFGGHGICHPTWRPNALRQRKTS